MNFVIGDIHGEITKLEKLIGEIGNIAKKPQYIFIGDYIDKGESPKAVLDYLVALSKKGECIFLKGNHEFYWQKDLTPDLKSYLIKFGGSNTIKSFNLTSLESTQRRILTDYKDFFDQLQPYYIIKDYFISHSGLNPVNFQTQPEKLAESEFYFNRYEFIGSSGKYQGKLKIIFGHTGFVSPYVDEFKIGIDTAACFAQEQPLTAYCLDEEFFIDSNGVKVDLKQINSNSCPVIPRIKPWRQV